MTEEKAEAKEEKVEETEKKKEMTKKYAFFVGCTIQFRLPHIERLAREIFEKIGIELIDLDFTCCPTSRVVRDIDIDSWIFLAARNIAIAEKEGLPILSMCTGCTQTLTEAKHSLEDKQTRDRINEKLAKQGLEYKGESEIIFYAELIHRLKDTLEIQNQLGYRLAAHPGCHILRPSKILNFDDPENPKKLDELIDLTGCNVFDYPKKALCCGFPIYNVDKEAAAKIMKTKMDLLQGADAMVVLCPTCFEYYRLRQHGLAEEFGFGPKPVLHYMEVLGYAMGIHGNPLEKSE